MPRRTFERTVLALLLLGSCAVAFGDCDLIGHAQAQSGSSSGGATSGAGSSGAAPSGPAPTTPTQSPVTNPSSPSTVTQPSYTPSTRSSTTPSPGTTPSTSSTTPSTAPNDEATSAGNEKPASTNTGSERRRSVGRSRLVHRHHRGRATLVTYGCSHLGCVRTYAWAFPCQYYSRYCAPLYDYAAPGPVVVAPARWWPGYYDYAPGQFGRAAYLGRGHRAAYVAD